MRVQYGAKRISAKNKAIIIEKCNSERSKNEKWRKQTQKRKSDRELTRQT